MLDKNQMENNPKVNLKINVKSYNQKQCKNMFYMTYFIYQLPQFKKIFKISILFFNDYVIIIDKEYKRQHFS